MTAVINYISPAMYLAMVGVVYHLTGLVAAEREHGLSTLLESMGCRKAASHLSFFLAFSTLYVVGWIVVGVAVGKTMFKPRTWLVSCPPKDTRHQVSTVSARSRKQWRTYLYLGMASERVLYGKQLRTTSDSEHDEYALTLSQVTKTCNLFTFLGLFVPSKRLARIKAVKDLSISFRTGELSCLLGANGSGKTTTLEMIAGI
ncbi:hypothetical protein V1520DRAFT_355078 [Lipomyces starkeyi]